MKQKFYVFLVLLSFSFSAVAQIIDKNEVTDQQMLEGFNFIKTKTYTQAENQELLKLFEKAHVSDVSDAMDRVGLPNTGLVNPEIQSLWKDPTDNLAHVIHGIALTVRYVPLQTPAVPDPGEDFKTFAGRGYGLLSPEAFKRPGVIQKGNIIVFDHVGENENSGIGSSNILSWFIMGAVGVVTNANARDIDELTVQKCPVYLRSFGRGIRPGRCMLESVNRPVSIGGVLVCPGDVVVADGDGVIVVPRYVAQKVGKIVQDLTKGDNSGRAKKYKELGMPLDKTVQ